MDLEGALGVERVVQEDKLDYGVRRRGDKHDDLVLFLIDVG